MTTPQYKIHGRNRRQLKSHVSRLKQMIGSFWYHFNINTDCYFIYGVSNPLSKEQAQAYFDELVLEYSEFSELLNESYDGQETKTEDGL